MQNVPILIVYLAGWLLYMLGIYLYTHLRRVSLIITTLSHAVPTATALSMTYIFLIGGGSNVAQFAAGSDRRMDLWSLWFDLVTPLLLAGLASGLLHFVWTVAAAARAELRRHLPIAIAGLVMSVFSLFVVASHLPDA
ncbi:MAG: hypothetical protein AAF797_03530 [Planctomycetota bacterium]